MASGRMTRRTWGMTVLLVGLILGGCTSERARASVPIQSVTIRGHSFHLELALTPKARYQGLSGRKHIASDGGMLFVFPHPRMLVFVMRRCYVPIDLIYLDASGRVVRTYHMHVQPYDTPESGLVPYPSVWPAQFVIELKGGSLDALGLESAQRVPLPLEVLKRRAQ